MFNIFKMIDDKNQTILERNVIQRVEQQAIGLGEFRNAPITENKSREENNQDARKSH
jgi:hypothetical protein